MADKVFEPEIGQMLFSNTEWQQEKGCYNDFAAIQLIGAMLEETGTADADPCSNTGEIYEGKAFTIRAYCWCDGEREGHENGCPPNFRWRDFQACWYKHANRGESQNRKLSVQERAEMLHECLAEITLACRAAVEALEERS